MRIILHSYECMIHLSSKSNLHIRLLFVLNTSVSTQRYILFFYLERRIIPLRRRSNGILRWLIDFYLYHGVHHRRRNRARTEFSSTHQFWDLFLFLWSFSKYKWTVVDSKDQAPTKSLTTHRRKIISPSMVCTCMVQIEFQFRYSFMRVIQEKKNTRIHPEERRV